MKRSCAWLSVAIAALALGLPGCEEDRVRSALDAAVDASARAAADGGADASIEAGIRDCPAPESAQEQPPDALVLELPDQPPPGLPFPLAVRTASGLPLTAAVRVCASGEPLGSLQLYRGRGSVSLTLPEGEILVQAVTANARAERVVHVEARPLRELGPEPLEGDIRWGSGEELRVSGDLQLTAASTLTIEPGALVTFADKATLEVQGRLDVPGTAEQPVLFTRASAAAWGGIRLAPGSSASLEHVWIVAAGGDRAREWGHSHSQPVVWIDQAELVMHGGGTIDNPGKAFGADSARVELDGVLVSRCDTGGEFGASELHLRNGHVLEMPDADGQLNDDDNDGIYISGVALDAAGQPIESTIENSVFAVGEDDGIDHNNGQLRVDRVWIEGFTHEGIAASHGHRVAVSNSVVRGNGQGIEAGYGSPSVMVEHSLLTDNDVGLRFGDDYDKAETGKLEVRDSIILGNRSADVRNYVIQLDGPAPNAIQVSCSILSDPMFAGTSGNLDALPEGPWQSSGCALGPRLDAVACEDMTPGPFDCY